MQLILAIVADSQEAAQLAALIQGRLSVDLVQAAEVGEGLLALDDRVPDLILTSPLMSPFDDGVLDEYLRDLGPRGAHVQTLRIPVLSQAPKKAQRFGFSLRRKAKPAPPPLVGCEPKVFADEIALYLARAAEEKMRASSSEVPAVTPHNPVPEPAASEVVWSPAYSSDVAAEHAQWSAPEPEVAATTWRSDLLDRPLVVDEPVYEGGYVIATPAWEQAAVADALPTEPEPVAVETIAPPIALSYEEPSAHRAEVSSTYQDEPSTYQPEIAGEATVAYEDPAAEPPIVEPVAIEPSLVEPLQAQDPVVAASIPSRPEIATRSLEHVEASAVSEDVEPLAAVAPPSDLPAAPVIVPPVVKPATVAAPLDPNALKATPSFKAALEAIRAAWGKPGPKAAPLGLTARDAASQTIEPRSLRRVEPQAETESPAVEVPTPFEVDLTGAVETLDDPPIERAQHPAGAVPEAVARIDAPPDAVDVYELSVEQDLGELESQLFTPEPPRPKREAAAVHEDLVPAPVEGMAAEAAPRVEPSTERRKKSAKRPSKAAPAKTPRPQGQPQAAQDEWGIFDPNRCGFSALVDKLDEVSDKKPEQPRKGSKVRVISFS
jgi:hypothetical protein